MQVPYFRPSLGREESEAVQAVLDSGWLTTGKVTREFETEFAAYTGSPRALAVNSCTAALHLAVEAIGVGPGDTVVVPALTFAATAAVVRYLGAAPILADCEPETLCVDPDAIERVCERMAASGDPLPKAVIPVHFGGQMADVFRVHEIARRFGARVIEDAAHALPAEIRKDGNSPWQRVGTTSEQTCFSFYANKCITTGEGGMITSLDPDLAERAQRMSLHGLSKSAWSRFEAKGSWYYEIVAPGFKYNMTDLASAIGRAQLKKSDEFAAARRRVASEYGVRLREVAEFVETPVEMADRRSSWHLYPIRLHLNRLKIDRAEFIEKLKERGVVTSVHWMPLHIHPYYRDTYGYRESDFPVAAREWRRIVSLPIFPSITDCEIDYVCESIREIAFENASQPTLAMAAGD